MPSKWPHLGAIGILFLLVVLTFWDILFQIDPPVLSLFENQDVSEQFFFWRGFGFSELRRGNLALWNPYAFSGQPFFADMQSALLYPVNWLYLVFPLALAINLSVALNFLLSGIFMYGWAGTRGLSIPSRLLSSVIFMFCAAHFANVIGGQLSNISAMTWVPLLFMAVDKLFDDGRPRWILAGVIAVWMQILAGHPQYLFYTGIMVSIYTGLRGWFFIRELPRYTMAKLSFMLKIARGFIGIYLGGVALGAVQLFPAFGVALESGRGEGLPLIGASSFSFPPENLITFLSPFFFGDMMHQAYWGRWAVVYEVCIFIGIGGLVLALYGGLWGKSKSRLLYILMALIAFIFALGKYTPLFYFLYHFVPGFDLFRGSAKFIFFTSMFLILLAGTGYDQLLRQKGLRFFKSRKDVENEDGVVKGVDHKKRAMRIATLVFSLGVIFLISAYSIQRSAAHTFGPFDRFLERDIDMRRGLIQSGDYSLWYGFMKMLENTGEVYVPPEEYSSPSFIKNAGFFSGKTMFIASGTLFLLSLVFFGMRRYPRLVYLIAIMAVVEMVVFARYSRPTFDPAKLEPSSELSEFFEERLGDYRVFNSRLSHNMGMALRKGFLWGSNPLGLRRYVEFMVFSQYGHTNHPNPATNYLPLNAYVPLYKMLRSRYVIIDSTQNLQDYQPVFEGEGLRIYEFSDYLPRAILIEDWSVLKERDKIFSRLFSLEFDPFKTVILESEPLLRSDFTIERTGPGRVEVIETSTDDLTVRATLSRPAILLITDPYASGWRVHDLAGQGRKYRIQPANYILRAIPLEAGEHLLRIEYSPLLYRVGRVVSVISIFLILILGGFFLFKINASKDERS